MRVEQASLADVPELIELRVCYLTDDFGTVPAETEQTIRAELAGYLGRHLGHDLIAFVAREDGGSLSCCAWLLLVEKPPSPRFVHGRCGILFNVYTRPERRRQGLARKVMLALLDEARARELDVVELNATDDGYPLYQGLGFDDDSSTHRAMRMVLR